MVLALAGDSTTTRSMPEPPRDRFFEGLEDAGSPSVPFLAFLALAGRLDVPSDVPVLVRELVVAIACHRLPDYYVVHVTHLCYHSF